MFRLCTEPADSGQRLDRILRDALPHMSRAALQKAITAGHCTVDGLVEPSPAAKIRSGQCIELQLPQTSGTLSPEEGQLSLIWQDEDLVLCNKPAGLTVHPCPSCPEHTLVQRLLAHFPQLAQLEGQRPGIVHRLDKDTSGLLLAALNEPMRLAMSTAFAERQVHKTYLALVSGRPAPEGEIHEPLGRHPSAKIKMAVVPVARGGREAFSEWQCLWTSPDQRVSLLAVRIHTGRTHQIRVHMAHLGHPLLGDRLYAPAPVRDLAPRQMLHAWKLSFPHPRTGSVLSFSCPPPEDFLHTALTACRHMQRVVITGNPGSGKSALSRILAERGLPVVSADALVAELYAPGGEAAQWLQRRKGHAMLAADGSVDKKAVLEAMQQDAGLKRELEEVVHALVRAAIEDFWKKEEARGSSVAVAEIPLYFECGWQKLLNPAPLTVGVGCPQEQRLQRIAAQRQWSQEKAATLEAWQWAQERKLAACRWQIQNDGSLEDLEQAAAQWLEELRVWEQEQLEQQKTKLQALWS